VKARDVVVAALSLIGSASAAVQAAEAQAEYRVKAAFLYNFARFVQWPSGSQAAGDAFVITILGQDPFGPVLEETLLGKTVDQRSVVVRRVTHLEDLGPSHIVFISDSERGRLPEIIAQIGTRAMLTVGETSHFAERGGVIRFKVDRERIRLEINLASAERSGLKISSQLLKIAHLVGRRNGR
jgi:hypothetical protein